MPTDITMDIPFVDLMARAHKADPFSYYARLRADAPVYPTSIHGVGQVWLVTRHDDVVAVLKDKRFAKDPRNAGRRIREPDQWEIAIMSDNILRFDDPRHRRVRGLVVKAMKRCGTDGVMNRFTADVDERLDALSGASKADLVADFAYPLPLTAISDLIGIPREDQGNMPEWIEQATAHSGPPDMAILSDFLRYLQRLAHRRMQEPRDDLLSALAHEKDNNGGLDADEVVATAAALMIAGHDTAVNLLALGALELSRHPDQCAALVGDPVLAPAAVDEILRFTAPVEAATERFATEDVTLHGQHIKRSDIVLCVIASANRDPDHFPDPDRFDITRSPNPHLAFGAGAHFCMGAQLACAQAQIALPKLFERFPELKPALPNDRMPWKEMPILRGLEALPVTL